MRQEDIWDEETAAAYDDDATMFAPEVLDPTIDRLLELAGGGRLLEFAIGTGRVAVPLVRRGAHVAGIELSAPMIARLRTKLDDHALPVIRGDMARDAVPGRFSVVYLVFNTMANLLTQDEQVDCFRNAAAHLATGGRFVVELWYLPCGCSHPASVPACSRWMTGTSPWTPSTRSPSPSCRTTSGSARAGRPGCSAPRTGTSGRVSST